MNALATIHPLPSILENPPTRPGRRHRIGDFQLDEAELERFNALLVQLGRDQLPLDSDRVATAARELADASAGTVSPVCIGQRMRRIAAAALMVADPDWTAANDAVEVAGQVIAYVRGGAGLIPNQLPRVGRLDDAIVIDAAWPRLVEEVGFYIDFRRLLRMEAAMRGIQERHFGFNREQWQLARTAEAALLVHQRNVREGSYLSASPAVFRVH